jgi:hypothetical protein
MMTLIIIPTDKKRTEELIESFAGIQGDIKLLENDKLDFNTKVSTFWKMFMYEGEFLSKPLRDALPVFLDKGKDHDFFSVYKMTPYGIFLSPRLFKAGIELQNDSVSPVDASNKKYNIILDGFVLGV